MGEANRTDHLSPAQEQARVLAAVAGHLDTHPHLPVVSVDPTVRGWELRAAPDTPATFTAWCGSLGVSDVRVFLHLGPSGRDFAECRASARVGGQDLTLWTAVHGLQRHLVEDLSVSASLSPRHGLRLTVAELAHFAEHGVLPARRSDPQDGGS